MQNKELMFNDDARNSMLNGMEVLATAVGSTLGPKGQCVVIDDYIDEKPLITKDGVTVARNIQLKNKFENLGVQLLRDASVRSVEIAGDGTTTTVVLAYNMILAAEECLKRGVNPITLKNELKPYFDKIVSNLKSQAIPVEDKALIEQEFKKSLHEEMDRRQVVTRTEKLGQGPDPM